MNGFFQLLMVLCFLSIIVSFIGIPYAFLKKKRKKPFVTALGISILLLFISGYAYHQTESPDQLATDQKRHEERLAAKAQEKSAKEQAAADAKDKKEQDAADAELQKKYDDQAEYEIWISQKEQQKYNDQAEYEDWIRANGEICQSAGIGDTIDRFSGEHKLSNDSSIIKNYDDGHFIVVNVDGRIKNITITALKNHKRDKIVDSLIPIDAYNISTNNDNSDDMLSHHITTGKSDILNIVCPESNGIFTKIDTFDKSSGNYIQTTIATGYPS